MYFSLQKFTYLSVILLLLNGCDHQTSHYHQLPPYADDDTYSMNENISFRATVATNDTPSSNGENDWHILKNPLHGTITMEKNGSFTYSPHSNYYGTDHFLYAISDKFGQSNNATVTLNIKPVLFRIKVKTDNPGSSSYVEFQISVFNNGYNYNYNIDCNNDGKYESMGEDGSYICEYDTAGEYTIAIGGTFPQFQNGYDNKKILSVESWGTQVWKSFEDAFAICSNLILNAPDRPNLSQVTNMDGMFYGATAFNQPIGDWNVSNVTSMNGMFFGASTFNQPLEKWDVSHVTTMDGMFLRAVSFNQPLSDWNISNVTSTPFMFSEATAFNQSLEKWNLSNVTNTRGMFYRATAFNQPIGNWDVSHVTDMIGMFDHAEAFNQPIGNWDVSAVKSMTIMFKDATAFNQPLENWNLSSVTEMNGMFYNAIAFNQPLENWNVSSVEYMVDMFNNATAFNQPLEKWNVSSVKYMNRMFYNASSFSNQNLSSWNVNNVLNHTDFCTGWGEGNTPPSDWTCD